MANESLNTINKEVLHIANEFSATDSYLQSFEQLLQSKDVTRAVAMLENRGQHSNLNLEEYHADSHKSMRRLDRTIYDKEGRVMDTKPVNRIAIPIQRFINEVALVFLYGRPVLWENGTINPWSEERKLLHQQLEQINAVAAISGQDIPQKAAVEQRIAEIDAFTDAHDAKFAKLTQELRNARFDASLREAKRYAGAEGCSAMLFHTYQPKRCGKDAYPGTCKEQAR